MRHSLKIIALSVVIIVLATFTISVALSAGTPVVSQGTNPAAVKLGAVRYREFKTGTNEEVYLGIPDLDTGGAYRTDTHLTWGPANTITLTYDPVTDKLSTNVDNGSNDWTLDYLNYATNVRDLRFGGDQAAADAALSSLTYLEILVALGEKSPAAVSFDNVFLDGISLGNFPGTNQTINSWQVSGYDYSDGFTLTGVINLSSVNSPAPDKNNVQISLGYLDTLTPIISNVLAAPNPVGPSGSVALTATIDDSTKGNSVIQSAEYLLGTGSWTPMNAQDGVFDSPSEDVVVNFTAPASGGDLSLCVRGTDASNNTSPQECITLTVDDQGPISSNLTAAPDPSGSGALITLTADIDDSATGGSDISGAEYNLDGGSWLPLNPEDGAFDQPSESAAVTFIAPISPGQYNLCVRGTDTLANTGPDTCLTLTVDAEGPATTAASADPNPATAGAQVTISANVDDTLTGGSNIQSAEYSLDGSSWSNMDANDGSFDSPVEIVTSDFVTPAQEGTFDLCVRGTDSVGNTGDAACILLTLTSPLPQTQSIYVPIILRGSTNP